MKLIEKEELEVRGLVRSYEDQEDYGRVIGELQVLRTSKFKMAKDQDDYAKVEVGVNELANYIVSRIVDIVELIANNEGWFDSADFYFRELGIPKEIKYTKKGEPSKKFDIMREIAKANRQMTKANKKI